MTSKFVIILAILLLDVCIHVLPDEIPPAKVMYGEDIDVEKRSLSVGNWFSRNERDNAQENNDVHDASVDALQKRREADKGPKIWDQWGKWSVCTVTCGIGKITRWRHCVSGGCAAGEKEAQIKTCTLPAC